MVVIYFVRRLLCAVLSSPGPAANYGLQSNSNYLICGPVRVLEGRRELRSRMMDSLIICRTLSLTGRAQQQQEWLAGWLAEIKSNRQGPGPSP